MKIETHPRFAPAAYFCSQYSVSRTTWWRLSQSPGFPEPKRLGRAVRWEVSKVAEFLCEGE